jgi:hypothetical protein
MRRGGADPARDDRVFRRVRIERRVRVAEDVERGEGDGADTFVDIRGQPASYRI